MSLRFHRSLKILLLLCAWIPAFWQPLRGQAPSVGIKSGQKKPQKRKLGTPDPDGGQIGTKARPAVVEIEDRQESASEAAEKKREKDYRVHIEGRTLDLAYINTAFAGLLVLVGAGGICLAVRSLRALEKQTRATQDSVAVLMNSERAWVIISETHPPELAPISPGRIPPYHTFRFTIKNAGRTVARLMELTGETRLLQDLQELPPLPVYRESPPTADELGFRHGGVLAPGATFDTWIEVDVRLDDSTFYDIRNSKKVLYVYGFLRYFDFAEKERKTQFCYRYLNRGMHWVAGDDVTFKAQWAVAGPPDYNTHS
jgi:hypothetical protein